MRASARAAPFESDTLPAVLLGAATFFVINTGVVGVAVAIHQGVPILRHFRKDALFVFVTGMVLLFLAPIVVAATVYSPAVLPLFAAPILAIYNAGRQAVRSEHEAHHDSLTGLPNRPAFHEARHAAMGEDPAGACVMLMDLDRFKEVNDTLGHRYGDLLLQQVAAAPQAEVRAGPHRPAGRRRVRHLHAGARPGRRGRRWPTGWPTRCARP